MPRVINYVPSPCGVESGKSVSIDKGIRMIESFGARLGSQKNKVQSRLWTRGHKTRVPSALPRPVSIPRENGQLFVVTGNPSQKRKKRNPQATKGFRSITKQLKTTAKTGPRWCGRSSPAATSGATGGLWESPSVPKAAGTRERASGGAKKTLHSISDKQRTSELGS